MDDDFWRPTRGEAFLERLLGARAEQPARAAPRPRPARPSRRRIAAGVAVLVALGAAWAAFATGAPRRTFAPEPAPRRSALAAGTTAAPNLLAAVPAGLRRECTVRARVARCRGRGAVQSVEFAPFGDAVALAAAYRSVAGTPVGGRGASHCARGRPEERAWSRQDAPFDAAGRYRCTVVAGIASIWWTDTDALVLAHATGARGTNLAQLYAWWTRLDEGNAKYR